MYIFHHLDFHLHDKDLLHKNQLHLQIHLFESYRIFLHNHGMIEMPTTGLLQGVAPNKDHVLILDLYAEKLPRWESFNGQRESLLLFLNLPYHSQ
mgnify:CR=1 FL=1